VGFRRVRWDLEGLGGLVKGSKFIRIVVKD